MVEGNLRDAWTLAAGLNQLAPSVESIRSHLVATSPNASWRQCLASLVDDFQVFGGRFSVPSRLDIIGDFLPFI